LPVVRLYELHDEAYYVVRRADGRPLAAAVREFLQLRANRRTHDLSR
jgi:hypothetical protein